MNHPYYNKKATRQYYGGSGLVRIIIGMMLVFGSVGNHDFYDECLKAADCVAGDPPSLLATVLIAGVGLLFMGWGVRAAVKFDKGA